MILGIIVYLLAALNDFCVARIGVDYNYRPWWLDAIYGIFWLPILILALVLLPINWIWLKIHGNR